MYRSEWSFNVSCEPQPDRTCLILPSERGWRSGRSRATKAYPPDSSFLSSQLPFPFSFPGMCHFPSHTENPPADALSIHISDVEGAWSLSRGGSTRNISVLRVRGGRAACLLPSASQCLTNPLLVENCRALLSIIGLPQLGPRPTQE